jgi:hypothetical protein
VRTGALAVPEAFTIPCPWCKLGRLAQGVCSRCKSELRCSGFGNCESHMRHALSCGECACDLHYLPADFDWSRVVAAYALRGESLNGDERGMLPRGDRR